MPRTLSLTLALVALALLGGMLAPAHAEEASPAPASLEPASLEPAACSLSPLVTLEQEPVFLSHQPGPCGGTDPGGCDDCMGGCAFSCCNDLDCNSKCPLGFGSCTTENKCLCAC